MLVLPHLRSSIPSSLRVSTLCPLRGLAVLLPRPLVSRRPFSSPSPPPSDRPHKTSDPKAYASTLLLPRTSLPQRAPAPTALHETYGARTTHDLYAAQRARTGADEFVLLDGPPYANGRLHMGHSLNKVLKDIINRYQALQGARVQYIPGFDCHGLPIENKALDRLKADFHELEPAKIRQAAEQLADECVAEQTRDFEQMAVMADWSREGTYRTLDSGYEGRQLGIFRDMVSRGLIYRRHRPTFYSPSSRTALAESELKYKEDHVSRSVYVLFPVNTPSAALTELVAGEEVGLCIWTTTAWSLGSNMAIMVNEDLEYQVLRRKVQGDLVVVATGRREALEGVLGEVELVGTLSGKQLVSTSYSSLFPSSSSSSPQDAPPLLQVISSSHVSPSAGTGLVHCAPAHGAEDHEAYQAVLASTSSPTVSSSNKATAPLCPIDDDGRFTAELGDALQGQDILGDGLGAVIEHLKARGALVGEEVVRHKYPYDWKTKKPVIVRATSQWFANLETVKPKALEALKDVRFVPKSSRRRLEAFVESRSEWCISRQRTWGVPIPVLYDVSTGLPLLDDAVLAHTISVLASRGSSHWWAGPVSDFLPPALAGRADGYRKGMDTMDVWFDSGSAWSMLPDRGADRPLADVVLEGSDQHRGWFQSLLLTYVATAPEEQGGEVAAKRPRAPFGTVITHGFTLDEKHDKMSKSEGNVISPLDIIHGDPEGQGSAKKALGADALRVWVASCDYTGDMSIGPRALELAAGKLQRFRVLFKFLLGNLEAAPPSLKEVGAIPREDLSLADRFVLNELFHFERSVKKSYDDFAFHEVLQASTNILNLLSASYFEMVRDTLYAEQRDAPSRQRILAVLREVLDVTSQAIAPIAPFLAEELHDHRPDIVARDSPATSVFTRGWKSPHPSWEDAEAKTQMSELLRLKSAVQGMMDQVRVDKNLTVSLKAHLEISVDNSKLVDTLYAHHSILAPLFSVSHVTLVSTPIDEPQSWEYSREVPSDANDKEGSKLGLRIFPSAMHKCPRCWVYSSPREEMLCVRCEGVVRELEERSSDLP